MKQTHDLNIAQTVPLISPEQLRAALPLTDAISDSVHASREVVKQILSGQDPRLLAIVGPCSIHDPRAGLEYATRLAALHKKLADRLFIVMRVYFEKPRTTLGWKGLINDPHLNNTFDMEQGLRRARQILLATNQMGLPTATEMLEPITPQYVADLVTISAIGARTTESPTHRQMASGLSMPVGFKNGTDGGLQVALDAMRSSQSPHAFLGINAAGNTCIIHTRGNPWGFMILRGGRDGPNFDPANITTAVEQLQQASLPPRLVVDCSHANSNKDYKRQGSVFRDVIAQRVAGNTAIVGAMLESNLCAGNQKLGSDPSKLAYGVSITDPCVDWPETEQLLQDAYAQWASCGTKR